MKKYFKVIIIILFIILLIVGFLFRKLETKPVNTNEEATYFSSIYTKVDENNVFKRISEEGIINLFENGTGILYLGFPKCLWCQKVVPVLNESAINSNIRSIYYIDNFYDMRPDKTVNQVNKDGYNKIVEKINVYESENDIKIIDDNIIKVPLVIFVQNGKIISYHKGTFEGDNLKVIVGENGEEEFYLDEFTDEQKKDLIKIFDILIEKLYSNKCKDSC